MMKPQNDTQFHVGDRVRRRRGRQTIGVIERLRHPTPRGQWAGVDYSRTIARVRWLGALRPFSGGRSDMHSNINVDSLVLVEE